MLAEQQIVAESLSSILVAEQNDNGNINESGSVTPIEGDIGGVGDNEQPQEGEQEQLSASKAILNVLEQQEKRFQMQEEARKEKLRQSLLDKSRASPSYYKNSPKEYLVLKYIENFNRQYLQLYPGRKELGLIRNNEFGVQKFVSTTIRPTQLPFKQLYDYRSCASFVSDFIQYQPLDPPYELPKVMPSPTYTIAMQSGNSFDMATLLASLLIGVGYDAYVVSGYAAKHVTLMDQTHKTAEDLKNFVPINFAPKQSSTEKLDTSTASASKYKVKQPKHLKSNFLLKQEERLKHLQQQQEKRAKEAEMVPEIPEPEDELKGLRVHAWVLVAPGKREVAECFFIEPTTGAVIDTSNEAYLGLECVWSSSNFWVNMQICYDGLKGVSFDLGDTMKWEFVLLDNNQPNGRKTGKDLDAEEDEDDKDNQSVIVDMPPSWVDRLTITLEQFESKCPTGGKATLYRNAKSEVFAQYHRNDGMIRRIAFNQKDSNFANMLVETFANRKDRLSQRVRVDNLVQEFFMPGRSHGLREHIMRNGLTTEMTFYGPARPDGLIKRTEEPRKIIYYFEDREDNLVYKSLTYEVTQGENGQQIRGGMIKMAEKFLSDPTLEDQNIAKKTYFLKDDRIRIVFHLQEGRIVPSLREFRKPPQDQKGQTLDLIQNFIPSPKGKPMKQQEMYLHLLDLIRAEQAFLQTAKNYERELAELLQFRVTEEQELSLSISIYDTLRNDAKIQENEHTSIENLHNANEAEETNNGAKSNEIDYLSPFLINIENPRNLSKEDAIAVKDACLKSLRERLVEKANIIQGRLDDTTISFQQRQLAYSKNADSMTVEETEEYVKFCNEALFKIHILEKRLAKHKENAPDRYIELDAKLRSDARLALAFAPATVNLH